MTQLKSITEAFSTIEDAVLTLLDENKAGSHVAVLARIRVDVNRALGKKAKQAASPKQIELPETETTNHAKPAD